MPTAGSSIEGLGDDIADAMQRYHKRHVQYDTALGIADVLTRIGVDKTGRPVVIPMDEKGQPDKSILPALDKKAVELYRTQNSRQWERSAGALEALSRIGVQYLNRSSEERITPKYDVTIEGQTYPLSAAGAASVAMQREQAKGGPAGKQWWEGDTESPAGYYTPKQISDIANRKLTQQVRGEYRDIRTKMALTKQKAASLTDELAEFTKAQGVPASLLRSTTKVYAPGTSVYGKAIPQGYYGVEVVDPRTNLPQVRHVGTEEFTNAQKAWDNLVQARKDTAALGETVQTEQAKSKAMLDWATRNPSAPGAAQAKIVATRRLQELESAVTGVEPAPAATPPPYTSEEE